MQWSTDPDERAKQTVTHAMMVAKDEELWRGHVLTVLMSLTDTLATLCGKLHDSFQSIEHMERHVCRIDRKLLGDPPEVRQDNGDDECEDDEPDDGEASVEDIREYFEDKMLRETLGLDNE